MNVDYTNIQGPKNAFKIRGIQTTNETSRELRISCFTMGFGIKCFFLNSVRDLTELSVYGKGHETVSSAFRRRRWTA